MIHGSDNEQIFLKNVMNKCYNNNNYMRHVLGKEGFMHSHNTK